MREIKFRVWATNNKHPEGYMYYSDKEVPFLLNLNGDLLSAVRIPNTDMDWKIVWARIGYTTWELMQFTGLKDKNGKEIYEGDIIRNLDNINYEIIWIKDACCFAQRSINNINDVLSMQFNSKEIIGNIYENPELLTEKKEDIQIYVNCQYWK